MEVRAVRKHNSIARFLLAPMKINRAAFGTLILMLVASWICLMILFYSNQNLLVVNREMIEKQRIMLEEQSKLVKENAEKIGESQDKIESNRSMIEKNEGAIEQLLPPPAPPYQ